MTTFVAIYRGETVASARLVAVSADPTLVAEVSARLLHKPPDQGQDPVIAHLERGRHAALRLIREEADRAQED